ncbi:MAG: response regulator, partial [bacterium]
MVTDNLSILVADDNLAHAEMIERYLSDESVPWDIELKAENHPSQCLSALKASDFDLVFLDYRFPGTTGFDVLTEIRQEGLTVPIVMLTGQGSEEVAAKAVSKDIKDYLRKEELDPSTLVKSIKKALIPEGFILDEQQSSPEPVERPELLHKKKSLSSTHDISQERI